MYFYIFGGNQLYPLGWVSGYPAKEKNKQGKAQKP